MAIAQSLDALHRSKDTGVSIRKTNRFQVAVENLHFMDGFNTRDYESEETKAHIQALTDAYVSGDYVPPIIVKVVDGTIYVLEGHCRTLAMRNAIDQGADLGMIDVDYFRGSELEADALVLTSNQSLSLTALERAQKYQHMINRGATASEIGRLVKKTSQHVSDYLAMHEMPDSLKKLINDKAVSPTEALARYREIGSKAADEILAAREATGKTKVTSRDIDKVAPRKPAGARVTKKVVTAMVGQFRSLGERVSAVQRREDGSATLELSAAEIDAILSMRSQLPDETAPAAQLAEDDQGATESGSTDSEETQSQQTASVI